MAQRCPSEPLLAAPGIQHRVPRHTLSAHPALSVQPPPAIVARARTAPADASPPAPPGGRSALVTPETRVQVPALQLPPKVAGRPSACRRTNVANVLPPARFRPPGAKRLAQTVALVVRVAPSPLLLLTGDHLGRLRMPLQSTRGTPRLQRLPQALHRLRRPTRPTRRISLAFARDGQMVPRPPPSNGAGQQRFASRGLTPPLAAAPAPG